MSHQPAALLPDHSRVSLATLMRATEANLLGNMQGGELDGDRRKPRDRAVRRTRARVGVLRDGHQDHPGVPRGAIDEEGNPRSVPQLLPETPDEVRRMREAEIRRAHRLARKLEIDRGREREL